MKMVMLLATMFIVGRRCWCEGVAIPIARHVARQKSAAAAAAAAMGCCLMFWCGGAVAAEESAYDLVSDVARAVEREYVDQIPSWSTAKRAALEDAMENPDEGYEIARKLLEATEDKFTRLVSGDDARRLVSRSTGTSNGYVGAFFQGNEIVAIEPGSPADGILRIGDRVAKVDDEEVKSASDAVFLLSSKSAGSTARVELADRRTVDIVRAEYPAISRLGRSLRINDFSRTTPDLLRKQNDFDIIDLRGNGGGALDGGSDAAQLFLKKGDSVATFVETGGRKKAVVASADGPFAKTPSPLYLVVDSQTASAAELFAGALSQNRRALLVSSSERTYGKAKVQRVLTLPGGDLLLVTRARYLLPKGDDINGVGLVPDRLRPSDVCDRKKSFLTLERDLAACVEGQ